MVSLMNIADMADPKDDQGRTYREVNAAIEHSIPVGTLVELDGGERMFVVKHTRDCDQSPLYCLGVHGREELLGGYPEYCLTPVTK